MAQVRNDIIINYQLPIIHYRLIFVICSGGDLHYHLTQRNSFTEPETRFYAAEVILGLEHMHNRSIVYRDLKVRCRTFLCF